MRKIKYACENCGWETSIWEEWEDLKPQRCMNKKCNTSFRLNPEKLKITRPEAVVVKQESVQQEEKKSYGKKHKS
jgi:hypothetical protein